MSAELKLLRLLRTVRIDGRPDLLAGSTTAFASTPDIHASSPSCPCGVCGRGFPKNDRLLGTRVRVGRREPPATDTVVGWIDVTVDGSAGGGDAARVILRAGIFEGVGRDCR
jgi:hypothetical protein